MTIIVLTLVIEIITVIFRFGFKLESTRDTATTIGRLTFGVRIHHGYVGVVLFTVGLLLQPPNIMLDKWLFAIGAALFISDIIHHFLVLWPIVGSHQFDLVYPKVNFDLD